MKPLTIRLCAPRGFCAGVERAIEIVVLALKKYGPPVYVRHEIVHNQYVVDGLRQKGAIFVEELSEIPHDQRTRPVVFSAHGVAKSVFQEADFMNLFYLDATCPLVSKVHKQALRHHRLGRHVLLIGHAGHPEVVGTMGQLPSHAVSLVETQEQVDKLVFAAEQALGYVSQTTLSVVDTFGILERLREKFPQLQAPAADSICYATTNRQTVVAQAGAGCDLFLIVGAANSSNSRRLVEVAKRAGAKEALLIQTAEEIPWSQLPALETVALSAGASAPEILVKGVLDAFAERYQVHIDLVQHTIEKESFLVNRVLRDTPLLAEDMCFVNGRGEEMVT